MNRLVTLIILILVSPLLFACAIPKKEVLNIPDFRLAETSLTKQIYVKDTTAVPIEPTLVYTTEDREVISYIKLKNLSGEHRLRWDWIGPDGGIYSSSGDYLLKASKGRYREETVAWHRLTIRGNRASDLPGEWQIRVYIDGSLVIQRGFTIMKGSP
ncbi:MAG: hypothetical protein IT393_03375 [Nitrospirae bacterium]|nr:hypothetical protein [Nitrospirota bacterium]